MFETEDGNVQAIIGCQRAAIFAVAVKLIEQPLLRRKPIVIEQVAQNYTLGRGGRFPRNVLEQVWKVYPGIVCSSRSMTVRQ